MSIDCELCTVCCEERSSVVDQPGFAVVCMCSWLTTERFAKLVLRALSSNREEISGR